ncbi:DUF4145 domain-containing protein [Methyloterricola oryzae]|uniref:DUF4145 domain-containing protein n=1 Tax=Methyloterricola oryzae TaxID=1495050 RepID=UPI00069CB6AE|nr:DUF4145 domain-containing protein [Methyloterricola oryzae]
MAGHDWPHGRDLFLHRPQPALLKLRQFGELLAQELTASFGLRDVGTSESQLDLLKRLDQAGALTVDIKQLFHKLRKAGNAASHGGLDDHRTALENLKLPAS